MGTNLHEFLVDEVGVDMKVAEVNERNSIWHVGTHGSCVLDICEVTIRRSRKCPLMRTHEPCVPTDQVNFPHGPLLPTTYYLLPTTYYLLLVPPHKALVKISAH